MFLFILLLKIAVIKCTPTFIQEIKDIRATIGEKVSFICQFSGYPYPGSDLHHNAFLKNTTNNCKTIFLLNIFLKIF